MLSRTTLTSGRILCLGLLTLPALGADRPTDSRSSPPPNPAAASPGVMPRIVIVGTNLATEVEQQSLRFAPLDLEPADTSPAVRARIEDSAGLLADVPGAAIVRNGPQTGLVQLRGLHGDRVKTLVDGMTITPACPNHMDPPLHYAAPAFADAVTVLPGVTPVSLGGDSVGGAVLVNPPRLAFPDAEALEPRGEFGGGYRSHDDGYGVDGSLGLANRRVSLEYRGSYLTGEDYRFPGGRVRDTGFTTLQQGGQIGTRTAAGDWALDAGAVSTRDAGTPALPMDMIEDDSYRVGVRQAGEFAFGSLENRFYVHRIRHLMDNYSIRPAGPLRLFSPASSDDLGFRTGALLPRGQDSFGLGAEFHGNWFDAYQQNPDTGLRQDSLNEIERLRGGAYAEWLRDWSDRWSTRVGLRSDAVSANAAEVEQFFPAPPAIAKDAAAFNASDRSFTDLHLDAMAAVRWRVVEPFALEFAAARKTRSPSSLERYLWTPLSANAGQADGRTYLGNLALDSEVSHQLAFTIETTATRWQIRVTPFYNFVTDYIQGVPIDRRDVQSRPVLQYQNLDRADLYGVDGRLRYAVLTNLFAGAGLSYVRGQDLDHDDNLYRIAPLRGRLTLDWETRRLTLGGELELVARQDDVAAYNQEHVTPGYVLLHLRAGYRLNDHLRLEAGVENLLDEEYADHLGGINRVNLSDVPVGARIPGPGRRAYVSLRVAF